MERTFKIIIDDDSLMNKEAVDQKIIDSLEATSLSYVWNVKLCEEITGTEDALDEEFRGLWE